MEVAVICGTILIIAAGVWAHAALCDSGVYALRRTANAIKAEKLKSQNKELLDGKYV